MLPYPPALPGMREQDVDTPALIVDLDALDGNLEKMHQLLAPTGVRLRAHAKTHKSPVIAQLQMRHGAIGQCVQKVSEGYDDRTDIILAFRTKGEIDYDYRDRAQQRRMVHDHFDGLGWKIPAMLEHVNDGDDFYFDRINQIRMPQWSKGRVALVGDAGYCVSPVAGMGGSMALIGAGRLAHAMEAHGGDHVAAFREYHDNLRGFVDDVQARAEREGMPDMFPSDETDLAARDRKLRDGDFGH